jgi:hypothetical protein
MSKTTVFRLSLSLLLTGFVTLGASPLQAETPEASPEATSTKAVETTPSVAIPLDLPVPSSMRPADADTVVGKAGKLKRRQRREGKVAMTQAETLPVMAEINALKWEEAAGQARGGEVKRIGLEKIFHETLANSIAVKQADVGLKDAESQAKEARDPNLFNLLNPMNADSLKKAAAFNVQAAQAHLQAAQQKALLDSAGLYAELTRSFLEKYMDFQAIDQGKRQFSAEQQHFQAGDTTSFDVTQTQMALIDRYTQYMKADNTYHTASMALSNQIGASSDITWVPEDSEWQSGNASVPSLHLIPEDLTLEKARKVIQYRPDVQELGFRKEGLERLVKAASGADKEKKKAELHQLELEQQKALSGLTLLMEKAYSEMRLSGRNLNVAKQQYALATRFVRQLHVSHEAGFSSTKEVLDGELELTKANTALVGAQLAYNLSQIQLVYELGVLNPDVLSRPISWPANTL